MFTCTGVSFAHGSNDGQKGMGLIMLILVGILPTMYALKENSSTAEIHALRDGLHSTVSYCLSHESGSNGSLNGKDPAKVITSYLRTKAIPSTELSLSIQALAEESENFISGVDSLSKIAPGDRGKLRSDLYLISSASKKLARNHEFDSKQAETSATQLCGSIDSVTNFIPIWVKVAVAVALGCGTMIGWKRIVVTVGEKIGKTHMSYGQGAAAELVAMLTIGIADRYGLPVSTTHVLSSGVAGTMAANGSGLQMATVRNILMAWVLTLPVCVFLGAALFALGLNLLAGFGLE